MTEEERSAEGGEETIEDLDAPAAAQADVAGGVGCGRPSLDCASPTCAITAAYCADNSRTHKIVVYLQ
jgi:hypothetical protein